MRSHFRIGLSSCFFHADPARALFKGKTLLYLEQSIAHWIQSEGALVALVPTLPASSPLSLGDLVSDLDGLVLQGGSDVAPASYEEEPLRPEWAGDRLRDGYEMDLVREFLEQEKPVLGICRGAQLLNVAFGGTLYQDIRTQVPNALVHRDWEIYDQNFHEIRIEPDSGLANLYPGVSRARVNTVHHQGIKDLGRDLTVEAVSVEDGIVEAIRVVGAGWALALQWHPEFQDPADSSLLDCKPILRDFLREAAARRP